MPLLGEVLSLAAALTWAIAVILFKRVGDEVSAPALNLFKNTIAVVAIALVLPFAGTEIVPDRPFREWALLAASGVVGIAIADTLFFLALARIGAGLLAIVDAFYSPSVLLFSHALIGERVGTQVFVGGALVVSAIAVGSADPPPQGRTRRDLAVGVTYGALAVILMAIGIVAVKNLLETMPVLWAAEVRLVFAGLGLLPLLFVRSIRRDTAKLLRPGGLLWAALPAGLLGGFVSMVFWIGGMKYTLASVSAILNQLTTIFIVLLAAAFLRDRLTPRRVVAVIIATIGAVLVVLR